LSFSSSDEGLAIIYLWAVWRSTCYFGAQWNDIAPNRGKRLDSAEVTSHLLYFVPPLLRLLLLFGSGTASKQEDIDEAIALGNQEDL
jgi:hypothetical protein